MKTPFYTTRPLTPHFGIEALSINLADTRKIDLTDKNSKFLTQLKSDLIRHRTILFRNQTLSGQRQVDISNALGGRVQSTFYKHPRSPHPDVFRVSNDDREGCTSVGRSGWHLDGTFQNRPFMYQTMYFPSVAEGGDTYFVPLKELYESFGEEERMDLDRMWMATGRRESPVHPLVYRHPFRSGGLGGKEDEDDEGEVTMLFHCGRPFVSGWYCDDTNTITGDNDNENNNNARIANGVNVSRMIHPSVIQDRITTQIESKLDEIGIRMKWEQGDFMISDNLGLAHYASEGTQGDAESVGLRILHRTTIVGGAETVPVKFDGRKSFSL
mmetsp:Transcript_23454/g.38087  ORF Transcript_23454/g.38087 Transcript_23454/m.38087 type:complete len:327 (-) Transcript_23454:314-1294(-)|eukprot:CAMPEP_0196141336 /NCGR_PEP_ID=MMETSP0910-20130528/9365_1 /TAXON_ID=49265 /ORGANISM="Thalassiosira rotula, Strain GSO102" /LENGTH=326 /DNA_ID=CAMNT_0041402465 /DNA_START=158 /DNA_END=1138 /DNA_ORIENTATION=+